MGDDISEKREENAEKSVRKRWSKVCDDLYSLKKMIV
jgi:hypothetical protein